MISAQKITDIMGLSSKIETLHELNEIIIQGIPKKCLEKTVSHLSSNARIKKDLQNRLVPSSTYKRRKDTLKPNEGERVARIARIYAETLDVWGDKKDAQIFLFHPHSLLNHKTPIDMAFTSLGAELVEKIINEIRYGLPA